MIASARYGKAAGAINPLFTQEVQNEYITRSPSIPMNSGYVQGSRYFFRGSSIAGSPSPIVIEPIFEADFQDNAYGFRPKRSAHQAVDGVRKHLFGGKIEVIEIEDYPRLQLKFIDC